MIQGKTVIEDLGLIDYEKADGLQKEFVADVIRGGPQKLIICEHPTVLTLGRLAKKENILCSPLNLQAENIKVIGVDRGGDVTLHAPGQLVLYPILNLRKYKQDLKYYLHKLEQVAVDFLQGFDILGYRIPQRTGVWVKTQDHKLNAFKKIAAIGIGVKRWVTFHGLSINININIKLYSYIKPCGLDVEMISMRDLKGHEIKLDLCKKRLTEVFLKHF